MGLKDFCTEDVESLNGVGEIFFEAVSFHFDELFGEGACGVGTGDDLIFFAGRIWDVITEIDLEACGFADEAALKDRLTVAAAITDEAFIFQEEGMVPGREDDPAAEHRDIMFGEGGTEIDEEVVSGVGGRDDDGIVGSNNVCGVASIEEGRSEELIDDVVDIVASALHSGVEEFGMGLSVINIFDLEVKVFCVVDFQVLHSAVEFLGIGDILSGVIHDSDIAELINVDGIAEGADIAFIVAVQEAGVDVGIIEVFEQTRGPDLGDEAVKSHKKGISFRIELG